MTETTVDLTKLRTPFAPEMVGKLPRVTCGDCSDRNKQCTKHNKVKCGVCQAYVSEKHIHIDYVGHADVTDRLLSVDPEWNWEPKAEDEHGLPVFDADRNGAPVGLWIKLTVGGVTRLGYGSCPSGQGDAVKVLIGDALRNAAMRFGVALDLWAKGDRADPTAENATASAGQASRRGSQSAADAFENAAPAPARQNGSDGQQRGQVSRPAQPPAAPAPEVDETAVADWAAKVDEIASAEDADRSDAELRDVFKSGRMNPTTANAIRVAIRAKREAVAQRETAGAR